MSATGPFTTPVPAYTDRDGVFHKQYKIRGAITASRSYNNSTTFGATGTMTAAVFGPGVGYVLFTGQTAAVAATTPTAVLLATAFRTYINREPLLNEGFEILMVNNNTSSGAVTITAGSGVTIVNSPTTVLAIDTARIAHVFFTGVTAGAETASIIIQ